MAAIFNTRYSSYEDEPTVGISDEDTAAINAAGIGPSDFTYAKQSGATREEILDAHSWNKGTGAKSFITQWGPSNIYGDRPRKNPETGTWRNVPITNVPVDRHLHGYARSRGLGATHDELKDAWNNGVTDFHDYANAKKSGDTMLSHEDTLNALRKRSALQEVNPMSFNSNDIEISPEEHAEIKGLDIDPDTFDKATHKRLRSMGATHQEIKDAMQSGAFIEDYEAARLNEPSHLKAVDKALSYKTNFYNDAINENKDWVRDNTDTLEQNAQLMPDHIYNGIVRELFGHHLSMKLHPIMSSPSNRRAHEFLLSECAKLQPEFKDYVNDPNDKFDVKRLLSADDHAKYCNKLMEHLRLKNLYATTPEEFAINSRKIDAVANIASSHRYPSAYRQDKYEEE
jgi:hypothetical protein